MSVPVILVHGFLSTQHLLLPVAWSLRRRGFTVDLAPELSFLAIQDVKRLADQLDQTVERVRAREGVERVDVVGVSQGGIIGLYWARFRGGAPRLRRLVTMGAPVRGSYAAVVGLPLLGGVSRGVWQLLPGSPFLAELGADARDLDICTISLFPDPVAPPDRCAIEGARNVVVCPPYGPVNHQALGFSRRVHRALADALL